MIDDILNNNTLMLVALVVAGFVLSKINEVVRAAINLISIIMFGRFHISSLAGLNEFSVFVEYLHERLKHKPHYAFVAGNISIYPKGYLFFIGWRLCYVRFKSEALNSGMVDNDIVLYIMLANSDYMLNFIKTNLVKEVTFLENEYVVNTINRYEMSEDKLCHNNFSVKLCNAEHLKTLYRGMDEIVSKEHFKSKAYLLHGSSGSGKSHLVAHLGSKYRMNILVIVYMSKLMDIQTTMATLTKQDKKAILLIEECDTLINDENISLFLNLLDGVAPAQNKIIIMTTNFYDKVDTRLLRKGRMQSLEFTQKDVDRISNQPPKNFIED